MPGQGSGSPASALSVISSLLQKYLWPTTLGGTSSVLALMSTLPDAVMLEDLKDFVGKGVINGRRYESVRVNSRRGRGKVIVRV